MNAGGRGLPPLTPVTAPEPRRPSARSSGPVPVAAAVEGYRRQPSPNVTERAFQDKVVQLAQWCGWKVVHFAAALRADGRHYTPVRYDGKGYPDLTMVHPERRLIWFREVKRAGGKLTPEQIQWRQWLVTTGANWEVWWPQDWDDIVAALSNGQAVAT